MQPAPPLLQRPVLLLRAHVLLPRLHQLVAQEGGPWLPGPPK